jgi:hypothetical protein
VRVRNVVAELRAFAANITYLCHLNLLQTCLSFRARPNCSLEQLSSVLMCTVSSQTGEGANEDTPTLQLAESLVYLELAPGPNRVAHRAWAHIRPSK